MGNTFETTRKNKDNTRRIVMNGDADQWFILEPDGSVLGASPAGWVTVLGGTTDFMVDLSSGTVDAVFTGDAPCVAPRRGIVSTSNDTTRRTRRGIMHLTILECDHADLCNATQRRRGWLWCWDCFHGNPKHV